MQGIRRIAGIRNIPNQATANYTREDVNAQYILVGVDGKFYINS